MTNNEFENNGNTALTVGGALYIKDSVAVVENTTFINNTAIDGGAVEFSCSSVQNCNLTLRNNTFIENSGLHQGGAIEYNRVRPTFENNIYSSNSAPYGPNIASYPVKIRKVDSSQNDIILENVGSGIVYEETLNLGLYDYDDQIMLLDSSNQIAISAINTQTSSISGTSTGLLSEGKVGFDSLIFVSSPGNPNVQYRATSKALDNNMITEVFGQSISDNDIYVNFRYCKPGETIIDGNTCSECSAGTYSFSWNSTECKNCIEDTVCDGGTKVSVNSEYWRRTTNSTQIIK